MIVRRLLENPRLARVFAALAPTGGETRVVGGAVRNALMGEDPHDIDLATTTLPAQVLQAARAAGLKALPTGIEHGTITIVVEGAPFEVTTLREDIETDGRYAKVRFGTDFERDALRRDFTVNALSVSQDGTLHDYAGGLADIEARRVRFIGDPMSRIAEDYLRILRFFRFHARFGAGPIDAAGLSAAIKLRENLDRLSRERIRTEIMKLLAADGAVDAVRTMSQSGIWEAALGVGYPARLERLAAIEAAAGVGADAVLRLAAVAVLTVEDADRLREKLRLSNAEHVRLTQAAHLLAKVREDATPPREHELLQFLFLNGRQATSDALALAQAESKAASDDPVWRKAAHFAAHTPAPSFPITGADLIARGVAPGKTLGATLKSLQANWIRAGFPRDPATLVRLVDEATKPGTRS